MTNADVNVGASSGSPEGGTIDMNLEVVTLPVTDVDRAKRFYQNLGWRLDADIVRGDVFRVVQLTPPHSSCSIAFGKGLTSADPGSAQRLLLVVSDIASAREDLLRRGVEVSEVFHLDGGRVPGRIRKDAPIRLTPRSTIRTATGGSCRRSKRGSRAASGRTDGECGADAEDVEEYPIVPPRTWLPPLCAAGHAHKVHLGTERLPSSPVTLH